MASTNAPRLDLTPEEQYAYSQLFQAADIEKKGLISGQVAVSFLTKSKLPINVLSEIWQIVDVERRGFLDQNGFYRALRLIALKQSGKQPSLATLNQPSPLPYFENVTLAQQKSEPPMTPSISTAPPAAPPTPTISTTPITNIVPNVSKEDHDRWVAAWNSCAPTAGTISGDKARDLFMKSGLGVDVLGKIWSIVDTSNAGKLNLIQFFGAMYLLTALRTGSIQTVPPSLSTQFWSTITSAVNSPAGAPVAGTPVPSVAAAPPAPLTATTSMASIHARAATATSEWVITESERQQYNAYFDKLDLTKKGYLTGEDSAPFFLKSKLAPNDLAQIWDLSDTIRSGRLDRDQFAVAMHLIRARMAGHPLPAKLPETLQPSKKVDTQLNSPVFPGALSSPPTPLVTTSTAPVSPNTSTVFKKDIDLMGPSLPSSPTTVQPMAPLLPLSSTTMNSIPRPQTATGGLTERTSSLLNLSESFDKSNAASVFSPSTTNTMNANNRNIAGSSMVADLLGDSSASNATNAGNSLGLGFMDTSISWEKKPPQAPSTPLNASMNAGVPTTPPTAVAFATPSLNTVNATSSPSSTFVSPSLVPTSFSQISNNNLSQLSQDVASKRNEVKDFEVQIANVSSSADDLKIQKQNLETELKTLLDTKQSMTMKLTQLKGTYETELVSFKDLESNVLVERQRVEMAKEELKQVESDLEKLRKEKTTLQEGIDKDRAEVLEIKRKVKEVGESKQSVKEQIDKLRKEAKLQQNLVDVNQQVLASSMQDLDKLKADKDRVQRGELPLEGVRAGSGWDVKASPASPGTLAASLDRGLSFNQITTDRSKQPTTDLPVNIGSLNTFSPSLSSDTPRSLTGPTSAASAPPPSSLFSPIKSPEPIVPLSPNPANGSNPTASNLEDVFKDASVGTWSDSMTGSSSVKSVTSPKEVGDAFSTLSIGSPEKPPSKSPFSPDQQSLSNMSPSLHSQTSPRIEKDPFESTSPVMNVDFESAFAPATTSALSPQLKVDKSDVASIKSNRSGIVASPLESPSISIASEQQPQQQVTATSPSLASTSKSPVMNETSDTQSIRSVNSLTASVSGRGKTGKSKLKESIQNVDIDAEFENAFDDLKTPVTPADAQAFAAELTDDAVKPVTTTTGATSATVAPVPVPVSTAEFGFNEKDFTFEAAFGTSPTSNNAVDPFAAFPSNASANANAVVPSASSTTTPGNAFSNAFDTDFSSAFGNSVSDNVSAFASDPFAPSSTGNTGADTNAFSFDDAFGPSVSNPPTISTTVPNSPQTVQPDLPPRAATTSPTTPDAPEVETIKVLGFSRRQAIEALEKCGYDVTLATDMLLQSVKQQ